MSSETGQEDCGQTDPKVLLVQEVTRVLGENGFETTGEPKATIELGSQGYCHPGRIQVHG